MATTDRTRHTLLQRVLTRPRRSAAAALDRIALARFAALAARGKGAPRDVEAAAIKAIETIAADRLRSGRLAPRYEMLAVTTFTGLYDRDLRLPPAPRVGDAIVEQFHRLYYHSPKRTWKNTTFLGVNVWKTPLDLWLYQELLYELRPDVIVETGTAYGGSALWLATICDLIGNGRVVTIDTTVRDGRPEHPRITYIAGSSTDDATVATVRSDLADGARVLVLLDAAHDRDHVLAELRIWSQVVDVGSYIVVEDTNVNGHPVFSEHGPGPMEAVDDFLAQNDSFVIDDDMHKFYLTFNPRGFLRRMR